MKTETFADRVNTILDMIGVDPKAVQVFENEDSTSVLYPNYFTMQEVNDAMGLKEEELIDQIEKMMVEHMLDIQHDLKLIKRYKGMMNET